VEKVQVLGGRYRLIERLGAGGMSVVWRAYDEVLGRPVAVKVLAAKLATNRDSRDMIRAEAQAAARLSHPHITSVYDYGESTTDGVTVPYVVMELISGRTLAERLAHGPLPWRAALRLGAEVAAALAAAHARGLVHRDVKPANVMLTAAGAKVVDFGIAAVAGESGAPGPDGMVLGTPAYLAPERLAGGPVRPATDVYALGLLLYRALTGELPWQAETTTQMISAHVYQEPSPLPAVEGLPDGVADLCLRCLSKNPADRPTSREVARTLAAATGIRVPLPADGQADEADDLVLDPSPLAVNPVAGRPPGRLRLAVAALLGPSVDGAAETAILPGSVIDSAAIRNARRYRRRRLIQIGGVTAGIGAVALTLTTCANLTEGGGTQVAAAADGPGGGSRPLCNVRYLTRVDTAGAFDVDVGVTNKAGQPLGAWALRFRFTGDQVLRSGSAGQWTQSPTGEVTVRNAAGGAPLAAGATATVGFSAGYHKANPMPTEFTLNGAPCSYVLVGASGETRTGGPQPDAGRESAGAGQRGVQVGAVQPGSSGGPTGGPAPADSPTPTPDPGAGDLPIPDPPVVDPGLPTDPAGPGKTPRPRRSKTPRPTPTGAAANGTST
jgi:eukaryotic-like serine/threonine-protein kinase